MTDPERTATQATGSAADRPVDRHAGRRERLRAATAELDAVLITSLTNVRYLTGFTGSNAALVLTADGAGDRLGTDGRYRIQAGREAAGLELLLDRQTVPALADELARRGYRRIGYESHVCSVDDRDQLAERLPAAELVSVARAVEALRAVKDATEIEQLRRAAAIADTALAELLAAGGLRPGRTERAVARELDGRMLDLGAEAVSFETIVAAGPHSAIPHHQPGDRPLAAGDLVTLDFGATSAGYHSDMTRTYLLGEPAGWQREIYDLVAAAQRAGAAAARPGAAVPAVDRAARELIAAAGYGEQFGHGLGHGVGLEIHEGPYIGAAGTGTLAELMTVTVEPGIYLEGRGGVRVEDTVVVRPDGPEPLTLTGKELTVLPTD